MKEIKAIIQPFMLERVIAVLHQLKNLPAITISSMHGLSVERGAFDQMAKTKLEIILPDELATADRSAKADGQPTNYV